NDLIKEKENRKKREEDEIIQEVKSHKLEKSKIDDKINNLLSWDNKVKKKITNMKQEHDKKKIAECTFKPKINKLKTQNQQNVTVKTRNQKTDVCLTDRLY